jgi:uncharacterized protein DUF6473
VSLNYQRKDARIIDYGVEQLHGRWFRGPLDLGPDAIAWLGAAQTWGRFVPEPFAKLVGARLGIGTLNLGSGGKGPEFFLLHPKLIEEANRCRIAVVQVLPARGSNNSMFRSKRGGAIGTRLDSETPIRSPELIQELIDAGRDREVKKLVKESRRTYLHAMRSLLDSLRVPKILLWISFHEPPKAIEGYRRTLGVSPQWVTREMVRRIRPLADRFVSVVSREGVPQPLRDREGNDAGTNGYYPSPEMHRLAADLLTPVVRELLGETDR